MAQIAICPKPSATGEALERLSRIAMFIGLGVALLGFAYALFLYLLARNL